MPELPEVETIARTLSPQVVGKHIVSATILVEKTLQDGASLMPLVVGSQIIAVTRRAKLLYLTLKTSDEELIMAFHLKMTGQLFVHPMNVMPGKHTKVVLALSDTPSVDAKPTAQVFFDDMRTFGYCRIMRPADLDLWPFWHKLGLEPLEHSPEALADWLLKRKGQIKNLLLDQTVVCGVGNIYADEVLFRTGLRPNGKIENVKLEKKIELMKNLQIVLNESIAACGSSIKDYKDANGNAGAFQNSFYVYGRGGEECRVCGEVLESSRVAGRGTVFCPNCQK